WNMLRAGAVSLPSYCGWQYLVRNAAMERHFGRLRHEIVPKRHIYLALLAVTPDFQGQGLASRLIKPVLERLDSLKLPSYLETQNERNVAIYQHFGFKLTKETLIPKTDLKMYLMLR